MDESKLEQYVLKVKEEMEKDRKENSYRNQEPFRTKRYLEENLEIIKEKGIEPGKKVRLTLIDMTGEVLEIREQERNSVLVKREDGETFAYSPREMEITN